MGAVRVHVDIPEKVLSGTVTGLACVYVSFGETAAPLEDVSSDATAADKTRRKQDTCNHSNLQEKAGKVQTKANTANISRPFFYDDVGVS